MEGCLVELADLRITNIGHICGARFGEKFELEKRKNYENEYKPRLVQTITQAQTQLAAKEFKLQEIDHQASDLGQRSSDFRRMFPGLVEILRRRAFGNISDVTESVERPKEEIDDLMASNPFQSRDALAFKEKYVGTISGFRFPMHDWSMSTGLRKLFKELGTFSDLKPRSLSMSDLQRWAHWAEDFDDNLGRTMKAIEDGNNFFCAANFQLFSLLAPSGPIKAQLRSLQVSDIRPPHKAATQHLPRAAPTTKTKQGRNISLRELRRLTGNKKIR
jgi:hypothetical protein